MFDTRATITGPPIPRRPKSDPYTCSMHEMRRPETTNGLRRTSRWTVETPSPVSRMSTTPGTGALSANREVILGRQRRSERRRRFASHYKRQRKYGITPEEFGALAAAQNHRCAICDRAIEPLCIDHDHHSGKIRGLLCNGCNVSIGYLGEDPARLRAAAHYVERLTAPAGATIQTHIRRGGGVRSNAPPC
jgi:Recombination endonuclease VII